MKLPEKVLDEYPPELIAIVLGMMIANVVCYMTAVRYLVYNFITFTIASVATQAHVILCVTPEEKEIIENQHQCPCSEGQCHCEHTEAQATSTDEASEHPSDDAATPKQD